MTEPTEAAPGCAVCQLTEPQLAARGEAWWECSHVACPQRKTLTAAPPHDGTEAMGADGSGCWRIKPVFQEH